MPPSHNPALGIAWDSRPQAAGGQRWFHLYPDQAVDHDDVLHWTRFSQNWNSQCAECHSTHLQIRYDPRKDSFDTRWSELDVACEACHGPGAGHVAWAAGDSHVKASDATKGLSVHFQHQESRHWTIDPSTGKARPGTQAAESGIDACAGCHSRRTAIGDVDRPGETYLDRYAPVLLEEGLYYSDGQMLDEVYVHGSFIQSRMYRAGVTCTDCHEPHSLTLRAAGDALCLRCHAENKYASTAHHFHNPESAGARCIACHMPARTYMGVDVRRDHGFRIPRPDLSTKLDVPNTCNACHSDRSAEWAAQTLAHWYGHVPEGFQRYAVTLDAARKRKPGAAADLAALVDDAGAPAIARATALSEFGAYLAPDSLELIDRALRDGSPLVRRAAVATLEGVPESIRTQRAFPLLLDPVRSVRVAAARILAGTSRDSLDGRQQAMLDAGIDEYVHALGASAGRPATQLNLGNLFLQLKRNQAAEQAFQTAIGLEPAFVPALVDLADLYRRENRDTEGEALLRGAVARQPDSADLQHALGLALIRAKRPDAALEHLKRAATLDTGNARYAYVYGVALHSAGRTDAAIDVLRQAWERFPRDANIIAALAALYRESGDEANARRREEQLNGGGP